MRATAKADFNPVPVPVPQGYIPGELGGRAQARVEVRTAATKEQQRERALAIANRRRLTQSSLRCEIRTLDPAQGAALVADVLEQRTEDLESMLALSLLMSVRQVGQRKAFSLLAAVGIERRGVTARLRDLTDRQRQALAYRLTASRTEDAA